MGGDVVLLLFESSAVVSNPPDAILGGSAHTYELELPTVVVAELMGAGTATVTKVAAAKSKSLRSDEVPPCDYKCLLGGQITMICERVVTLGSGSRGIVPAVTVCEMIRSGRWAM